MYEISNIVSNSLIHLTTLNYFHFNHMISLFPFIFVVRTFWTFFSSNWCNLIIIFATWLFLLQFKVNTNFWMSNTFWSDFVIFSTLFDSSFLNNLENFSTSSIPNRNFLSSKSQMKVISSHSQIWYKISLNSRSQFQLLSKIVQCHN